MHAFQKVIRGDHTKLPGFRQVLHPPLAVAELEISITPVIISLAEIRFKLYSFPEGQQSRSEIAKFGKHVPLVVICKSQTGGKLYLGADTPRIVLRNGPRAPRTGENRVCGS